MNTKATWGVIGMGVMGTNLSRNFAKKGISLALYNRFVKDHEEQVAYQRTQDYPELKTAQPFESLAPFTAALESPRKILIMLPAGIIIDQVLNELIPLLSEGDVLIDGGNSHYKDTQKRAALFANKKIHFLGMGVSGGEIGALNGPSLMVGGNVAGYHIVSKDLEALAAKNSAGLSCCGYLGNGGAGHYVKMVHNGIEYVEMQLIAEIFELCLPSDDGSLDKIQRLFEDWQKSSSQNYLLGISAKILSYKENGEPFIHRILDRASNKGTGAWATASGAMTGFPNSLMAAALHARFTSCFKTEREKFAKQYPSTVSPAEGIPPELKKTYDLCRWINHHQGFEMIKHTGILYEWDLDLAKVAQLWSEGCIIKSTLMDQLCSLFTKSSSILAMNPFKTLVVEGQKEWMSVIAYGLKQAIPIPCISSAWNYYLAMTQAQSSAHLIQAQRDFFGAHGFEQIDQKTDRLTHGPWATHA